jgi:hypothetical protein
MKLPANSRIALAALPPSSGAALILTVAPRSPRLADLDGATTVALTCAPALLWPDARGERAIEAALDAGGAAVLIFATLGDALVAHRRALAAMGEVVE